AQQVLTVQEALNQALNNNLQVKQALLQAALSEEDVKQAKMNFFPTLNAGIDGNLRWGKSFDQLTGSLINQSTNSLNGSLNASAAVFQGFSRINQVSANKYLLLADQSNIEKIKSDLVLSVVTTYLEALTNQDLLAAGKQQLALSQSQLEVEQINYDVGNKTLADLSQAKSLVAADELNVTSAENAYDLSILNLKQLMEMDPSNPIVLETPALQDPSVNITVYSAAELFEQIKETYPEIKQAAYNSQAAKTNIAIAKAGYYPELSLRGSAGTGYSSAQQTSDFNQQLSDNLNQYIGFSLSIPIFNNFRTKIAVSKARISYENALLSERQSENNLSKIINQAVLDLRAAEKNYNSTQQAFQATKEAFDVLKQRYDVGLANSIELSTSQTNMNKAEFDFIQARYNLIFRTKVIDYYLGKPITFN
ncbi:TolC family protein, partial [Albibacterium bauzanense]